ncbi:hypothetical protein L9F63_003523 [Diploptera punctata]|uniref:J domain-containing protein n=1 Tax=Diploptera punctata TaxID=6984 RepID=A0AAD7ZLL0_DIPPU|nr:hypothetical protein L9F63_003523 [Diploptera punctata]
MFLFTKYQPIGLLSIKAFKCFSLRFAQNKSKNHYDSLGLTPNATQADIKTAYYKLSMQYHPDKNRGSENAADIFRDITTAYEILGNLKLRKLYDKGILHTAGSQYAQHQDAEDMEMEDDSRKQFYKSREQRSKAPPPSGKSPIYDFDEWTQAHYGSAFARREAAKARYERKVNAEIIENESLGTELLYFLVVILITLFGFTYIKHSSYDVVEEADDNNKVNLKKTS